MTEKPPFPGCLQVLVKYKELLIRLKDYFFHNIELKITSTQTIQAYTKVYNLINQEPQKKMLNQKKYETYECTIFNIFKKDLTTFCQQIRQNLLSNKGTSSPNDQLSSYYQWFVHYTWFLRWAHKILSSIQKNNSIFSRTSLFFTGLTTMRDQIVEPLYDNIFRLIVQNLQLFKEQKMQQHIQLQFVIQFIGMCGFTKYFSVKLEKNDLGFYQFISLSKQSNQKSQSQYENDYFLRKFVNQYVKYLKKKYVKISEQMMLSSTSQYVNKTTQYLQKQTKAAQFFYSNTNVRNIIIRSIQQTLIANRCKQLIYNEKSGVAVMMDSDNIDGLKYLYKLTKRTSQQKIFGQCFQQSIQKYISQQVMSKLTPQQQKMAKKQTVASVINTLYDYFLKIQKIIKIITEFIKDPYDLTLTTCHLNGFQLACNKNNTICTFLAFYCDAALKKQPNAADLNSKQLIFRITKMLKFLYSLDQFLKIYQKMLGIRMLYDQFKNRELQVDIINMLKTQVGVGVLAKIVAMLQDYKFTQNFNSEKTNLFKMKIPYIFHITLLTSGQWPIQDLKNSKKLVPPQLSRAVQVFQFQYNQLYPGRQITWVFNYGRGIVQVKLDDDTKALLLLNNYQLLIVLLLQRKDFQALKIIEVISQIKPEDEPGFMASIMMLVKKGVLKKEGNPMKIQSKNQAISMNFGLKLKTPKLGCFQVPRFVDKIPAVNNQLNAQRGFIIQANIIKLMKTKRVLRYQDIITEVTAMCKTFKAEAAFVKNQIQNCIHKDYLQRDPKEFNTLIYKP